MGKIRDFFFSKETKQEQKIKEQIKGNEQSYAQAQQLNIATCNACGQDILNVPKILKNNGKIYYFHKGCYKKMCRGELPKPQLTDDKPAQEGQ